MHIDRKSFTITDRLVMAALALFWPEKLVQVFIEYNPHIR